MEWTKKDCKKIYDELNKKQQEICWASWINRKFWDEFLNSIGAQKINRHNSEFYIESHGFAFRNNHIFIWNPGDHCYILKIPIEIAYRILILGL